MAIGDRIGDNNFITINDIKEARRRIKRRPEFQVAPTTLLVNSKIEKMLRDAYPEWIK